jgi:hypothetical protein
MSTQPEALRLADALDAEFVQGRISNSTGRESAVELRRLALKAEQEPVAWMHNFITGNVITHIPADIGRHPERWTALYKDPTPCKTCESLAMAVMNDQTYHEKVIPKREWVGLNTDEMKEIADRYHLKPPNIPVAFRAIEAKLREKNHG